jgi:hypothetical protein
MICSDDPTPSGPEKRERRFRILAVFSQVEMHPADQMPRRMPTPEQFRKAQPRLDQGGVSESDVDPTLTPLPTFN